MEFFSAKIHRIFLLPCFNGKSTDFEEYLDYIALENCARFTWIGGREGQRGRERERREDRGHFHNGVVSGSNFRVTAKYFAAGFYRDALYAASFGQMGFSRGV